MITSYNLNGNVYELSDSSGIVERFYLPDSRLFTPSEGDTTGIRIAEDSRTHSITLSASELLAMGFATVALFTAQFNADKSSVSVSNINEGGTARLQIQSFHVVDAALGISTTKAIATAIPSGAVILGVSLNNDLAVTTSGGNNTYNAAFSGGSTTAIGTGILGALDTKTDKNFVPILTTALTNVTVTAGNTENFALGTISIVVYYYDLVSMANA